MNQYPDTEFQDPRTAGSLSQALQMWLALQRGDVDTQPHQLVFTLRCRSESRAHRVSSFLRRRLQCHAAVVEEGTAPQVEAWDVMGETRLEIQSLRGLERLSTWLRRAAASHQVDLRSITLAKVA